MAEDDTPDAAGHIQFGDSIQPVRKSSRVADDIVAMEASASEKSRPVDDEEQARRIAEEDLHTHRKQVSSPISPNIVGRNRRSGVTNGRIQTYSGFVLLWLSFQSVGVIYGDIG
jgi:KUP system potassium uptake protein